ncbi:nonstructural protein [Blackfly microvirus SF02]|uniref:Nonstructural protein n=1 Tax=Blackfly microvirus SF02 TaxID=2576452 RepID=A0A4P8PKP2_9VIRU|nr:nonstructural protein [Blackfly microvirus SF02]
MSVKVVCSVFDSASRLYGQPFFVPALAAAVRSVGDETNRAAADNALYQHPEDFELYHIGDYDDSSGLLTAVCPVVLVVRVKDLVQPVPAKPV